MRLIPLMALLLSPAVLAQDDAPAEPAPVETAAESAAESAAEAAAEAVAPLRSGRMEFDERLVKGETAAGAVVLFERQPRQLPGLVPQRRSYRDRIVLPVLGALPEPTQEPIE